MVVDNFDKIARFIEKNFWNYCCNEDYFWHAQIMIRHKDNPTLVNTLNKNKGNTNRSFMDIYLSSGIHLRQNRELITKICESVGARCYINLSPKCYRKAAKQAMINMTDAICTDNWKAARTAYKSATAKANVKKLFMIDYDSKDDTELYEIRNAVEESKNPNDTRKELVLETLPTKNGFHIICEPFDINRLKYDGELDIKKDALTLLYY